MTLRQSEIDQILARAQQNLKIISSDLDIFFVPHRLGGRNHALKQLYKAQSASPYIDHLKALLSQWINLKGNDHKSEFLGLTEVGGGSFERLFKSKKHIAVVSLNLDNYISATDMELDLYSLSWNVCFILRGKKFKKSPTSPGKKIVILQPSGTGQLLFNLKSDIFASLAVSLAHRQNAVERLAKMRAHTMLKPQKRNLPEHYPLLVALDQTIQILKDLKTARVGSECFIEDAWKASETIDNIIDPEKLKLWYRFAQAAQDMAWRNFTPEQILSAAIDGNEDIEIRKLGIMISQLTGVKPSSYTQSRGLYNPYLNTEENEHLHMEMIQEIFDGVLTRAVFINSAIPFYEKAAEQNMSLTEGRFLGWCGQALQEAGTAFETALSNGEPPVHMARDTFEKHITKTQWATIQELGDKILQRRRLKQEIVLLDLWEIMRENQSFKNVRLSIDHSIAGGYIEEPVSLQQARQGNGTIAFQGETEFSPFFAPKDDAFNTDLASHS
jgi:hypothetical protein